MSRTADYARNERALLEDERAALLADIEKYRAVRKDEKRFLDVDAETKKLAEVQAQIESAAKAGMEMAAKVKEEADKYAKSVTGRAHAEFETISQQITKEWDRLSVSQGNLKAEWDKLFSKQDELAAAEKEFLERKSALDAVEAKLKAVVAAHKENLDNLGL
jgi:uncharacterized protein YhaN